MLNNLLGNSRLMPQFLRISSPPRAMASDGAAHRSRMVKDPWVLCHRRTAAARAACRRVSGQESFAMNKPKRSRGFTLIELLIVVTIILIIAAFTIPRLTKAQIPAHEASALASIKAIHESEMMFSSTHPDAGFTPDLVSLGSTGNGGGEQSIDNNLANGRKSGYSFTYTPGEKINGAIRSYIITAVPDQVGTTGQRRFYSDESGEIHYNGSGPADASSPTIQ